MKKIILSVILWLLSGVALYLGNLILSFLLVVVSVLLFGLGLVNVCFQDRCLGIMKKIKE